MELVVVDVMHSCKYAIFKRKRKRKKMNEKEKKKKKRIMWLQYGDWLYFSSNKRGVNTKILQVDVIALFTLSCYIETPFSFLALGEGLHLLFGFHFFPISSICKP